MELQTNTHYPNNTWRYSILLAVVLGTLAFMMTRQPFGQDLAYHDFADKRTFFGVPNFFDVITNVPYLLVGLAGIRYCPKNYSLSFRPAWFILFIGVAMVGAGSAYYHLNPTNETLVWDRLPMTIGFMGLFVALLSEYVDVRLGRYLLLPALLIGFFSVLYWHWVDDLRLYFWVQGMPLLVVPLLVVLFKPKYSHQAMLLIALVFYVFAKVTEIFDREIFDVSQNFISGHSLKHLLSAFGILAVVSMLKKRTPLQESSTTRSPNSEELSCLKNRA
ncbi:MAG: ceramidase domain-containing protein [Arenicellales bacterium]|nr:ceramidase domain-containing protein [Arenicellales bacterium]